MINEDSETNYNRQFGKKVDNDESNESGPLIDMDGLVDIHSQFIEKVVKLCLLDSKSKSLNDAVLNVLQIALDFR